MDLNELFFRHQIALMRAAGTRSKGERERQNVAADTFASRIGLIQRRSGALAAPLALETAQ
ncbi:MAG: hypothetical protein AB7F98_01960 [Novosphingobium sp.]